MSVTKIKDAFSAFDVWHSLGCRCNGGSIFKVAPECYKPIHMYNYDVQYEFMHGIC